MLQVENLTKYYKQTKGIENLNFQLTEKRALGIIGINGSGKTTTFRLLLGLLKADSGSIKFNNKNISEYENSLFGYLPEERSLYKDLLVIDQVLFLGRLKNVSDEAIIERLEKYLALLQIPKYKYTRINQLSKGNQQKIQLICAIIHNPKIIILDEPLSGLDIINVDLLKKLIYQLKKEGKYILLSSHQFEHIEEFCDEIIILKAGDTMYQGTIKDLKAMSNKAYIKVERNIGKQYVDNPNIENIKTNNNQVIFEISCFDKAKALLTQINNEHNVKNIAIEEASIEMIVKANNLV